MSSLKIDLVSHFHTNEKQNFLKEVVSEMKVPLL